VVYEKERPRQRGSNRDEIVVLVVLLFWRGDIAGRCARFAPSEENETNVALIRSLYAHDTSLMLMTPPCRSARNCSCRALGVDYSHRSSSRVRGSGLPL
jgi:hypothetical protein